MKMEACTCCYLMKRYSSQFHISISYLFHMIQLYISLVLFSNFECVFIQQKGKIQASAKKHLIQKVKSLVEVGSAYEIENVLVTRNEPKYKCSEHRFKLNLIDKTNFTKIVGTKMQVFNVKNSTIVVSFETLIKCRNVCGLFWGL